MNSPLHALGSIVGTDTNIELNAHTATIKVNFCAGSGVGVKVNDPTQWELSATTGQISQKKKQRLDRTAGSRAVSDNVSVGAGGVYIGGDFSGTINIGNHFNGNGALIDNSIIIGGTVVGAGATAGEAVVADEETSSDNSSAGADIEIDVPPSFSGELKIKWSSSVVLDIAEWRAGDLTLIGNGSAEINIGPVSSQAGLLIDLSGSNRLQTEEIETGELSLLMNGQGTATMKSVKADIVCVEIAGACAATISAGSARLGTLKAEGASRIMARGQFTRLRQTKSTASTILVG